MNWFKYKVRILFVTLVDINHNAIDFDLGNEIYIRRIKLKDRFNVYGIANIYNKTHIFILTNGVACNYLEFVEDVTYSEIVNVLENLIDAYEMQSIGLN